MSESSFVSTTAGTCRTEWKRQKMYHKTEKVLLIKETKDPLPIVELKPFVKKVWRREKSFPVYYDHLKEIAKFTSKQSNKTKETEKIDRPTSPATSPEKVEMIIAGLTNDHQRTKTSLYNQPDSPRCRSRLHPTADAKAPKMLEHSHSVVPGFITREERAKSTLMEIQLGEALKCQNVLNQTLDRKDNDKPSIVNLNGDKISENGRRSGNYINPFRNMYSRSSAWHDENSIRGYSRHSIKREAETGSKTPFYDAFDRKGTLPSLQVCYTTIRQKPTKSRTVDDFESPRDPVSSPIHTVGGIANSLHVLSKLGNPTGIEHQISLQLQVDLRRFRRSRDYFPFDMTPSEIAKYYPPSSVNMTQGEILLKRGLESNASKRKRSIREKSHKSAPDKLETTPSHINYIREVTEEGEMPEEAIQVGRKILESVTSEILSSPDNDNNSKSVLHNDADDECNEDENEERDISDEVPNVIQSTQSKSALTRIAEVDSRNDATSSVKRENLDSKTPVTVPSAVDDAELKELERTESTANSEVTNDVSDANVLDNEEAVFEELERDVTQMSDRTFLTSAMSVIT